MALSQLAWHGEGAARSGRAERSLVERRARQKAWRRTAADGKIGMPNGVQRKRVAEEGSNTRKSERSKTESRWPRKRDYGRLTERTPNRGGRVVEKARARGRKRPTEK